jgi:hypothetical protein
MPKSSNGSYCLETFRTLFVFEKAVFQFLSGGMSFTSRIYGNLGSSLVKSSSLDSLGSLLCERLT